MSDIVERLRCWSISDCLDAADEIERLREELDYTQTLMREGGEQRAKDKAEIERLRSALETISIVEAGSAAAASMRLIAVRALSDKKEPNNG